MKTNKEYPATHSMDTAWFAVDLDGNIAIFQFEEEGPGPIPFTDLHTDELIPYLAEEIDSIGYMPFTEEQLDELESDLQENLKAEEIKHGGNIIIKKDSISRIIRNGAKIDLCYSKERGFYHLNYWSADIKRIQEFIDDGTITKYCECDIEIYFSNYKEDKSEHKLAHFPFFVYEQGCCINRAPERVVVPAHPFKEEQMCAYAKQYLLHLPVHFDTDKFVEPAEFIDSQCWYFNNDTKVVNGIKYMQVALTHGGFGYVKVMPYSHEDKKPRNWEDAPRVIDKGDNFVEPDNTVEYNED